MKSFFWLLCAGICFLGCSSSPRLAVDKLYIDRSSLVSTFVNSPDPRQEDPPEGFVLWVNWYLRSDLFHKNPLFLTVRLVYDNYEEETITLPINKKRAKLPIERHERDLLTYMAAITTEQGEEVAVWKNRMWFELIHAGE